MPVIFGLGRKDRDDAPPLSVVVSWRDRPEIERALAHNARYLPPGTETVIVNCGGDARALADAVRRAGAPGVRRLDVAGTPFARTLALNLGVHAARARAVFLLDADCLVDEDFVAAAVERLSEPCVVTVDRVFEESPETLDETPNIVELAMSLRLVDAAGRRAEIDINHARFDEMSRSAVGLALFERERFLAIGGMNSELAGWGWEDLDLIVRFQLVLGIAHRRMGRVLHMTHGDDKRAIPAGSSREESEQENFARCMGSYQAGRYIGTLEADVARWAGAIADSG